MTQHINYKHFLDCDKRVKKTWWHEYTQRDLKECHRAHQGGRVPCRYEETGENAGLKAAMTASLAVQMSGISSLIGGTNPHQPLQCRQCQPTQHIKLPLP